MSRREQSSVNTLRGVIREYYSRKPLEEPVFLHKREIALQSLEDGVYIRHLSFASMTHLYNYILREKTPLHLYYSSAYYEDPGNEKMDAKGWLGSDLLFDIDADKFTGCDSVYTICVKSNRVYSEKTSCPSGEEPIHYPILSSECFDKALYSAKKLYEILREEFGFREIKAYFSGNKGFHVKVLDEEVLDLTREERHEIASYITAENIAIEYLVPVASRRGKYALFSTTREYGVRKRILNLVREYNLSSEVVGEYVKVPLDELVQVAGDLKINIDTVVTMDTSRLSRFGFSLNCKSGLVVKPVDLDSLTRFELDSFNPWEGVAVVKPLVDAELPLLENKYRLKRGELVELELFPALYFAFKKLVKIINIRDLGVKDVRSLP